jgi:hypothetical protein
VRVGAADRKNKKTERKEQTLQNVHSATIVGPSAARDKAPPEMQKLQL